MLIMTVYETYIPVFIGLGIATYIIRVTFLIIRPKLLDNSVLQKGLKSIPNSLLVALVVPFTFFIDGAFLPIRLGVLAILITIPIVYYTKRPGLSLLFAIIIYFTLDQYTLILH